MVTSHLYSSPFIVQASSSFTVPCGCHPPPLTAPRDPLPPHLLSPFSTTVPRSSHPHHSVSYMAFTFLHSRSIGSSQYPRNRHPLLLIAPEGCHPPPLSALGVASLPCRVLSLKHPYTLFPVLSPWLADPWLPTPLTPPLKPPPLGN